MYFKIVEFVQDDFHHLVRGMLVLPYTSVPSIFVTLGWRSHNYTNTNPFMSKIRFLACVFDTLASLDTQNDLVYVFIVLLD